MKSIMEWDNGTRTHIDSSYSDVVKSLTVV